jgi:hypothetical protein
MHPNPSDLHFYIKTSLTFLVAVCVLAPCGWFTIGPPIAKKGPIPIENFIAYNMTVFIVLGFAVTIAAADRWPTACLWGGAAMLAGGAAGVLFGIPNATDESNSRANRNALKAAQARSQSEPAVHMPAKGRTLMNDTASWMSKFLAGAGFAQAHTLVSYFIQLSRSVASCIMLPTSGPNVTAVGAGLLLYFGILGFFCGYLLPYTFIRHLPGEGE